MFRAALCLLLIGSAFAEDASIAALFQQHGLTGTMVIASQKTGQTIVHNEPRAAQRFIAASTFKIPNSLIALEEKAVSGKDGTFKWNGTKYDFPDHNRDQTLASAFKVSCLWCYQEMAARVGAGKYPAYLEDMKYGKLTKPFDGTHFWLDGSLTISAHEQIAFLKGVQKRSFRFSPRSYDILSEIMIADQQPNYTLRAKTGWSGGKHPQVGWYVGYVETPDDVWFFALNIVVRTQDDLPLRLTIARQALTARGILK